MDTGIAFSYIFYVSWNIILLIYSSPFKNVKTSSQAMQKQAVGPESAHRPQTADSCSKSEIANVCFNLKRSASHQLSLTKPN